MGKNMADVLLKMTTIAVLEKYILRRSVDQKSETKGLVNSSDGELLLKPI